MVRSTCLKAGLASPGCGQDWLALAGGRTGLPWLCAGLAAGQDWLAGPGCGAGLAGWPWLQAGLASPGCGGGGGGGGGGQDWLALVVGMSGARVRARYRN